MEFAITLDTDFIAPISGLFAWIFSRFLKKFEARLNFLKASGYVDSKLEKAVLGEKYDTYELWFQFFFNVCWFSGLLSIIDWLQ